MQLFDGSGEKRSETNALRKHIMPTLKIKGAIWRMYISSVWYRSFCGVGLGGVQASPLKIAWTETSTTRDSDMLLCRELAGSGRRGGRGKRNAEETGD